MCLLYYFPSIDFFYVLEWVECDEWTNAARARGKWVDRGVILLRRLDIKYFRLIYEKVDRLIEPYFVTSDFFDIIGTNFNVMIACVIQR